MARVDSLFARPALSVWEIDASAAQKAKGLERLSYRELQRKAKALHIDHRVTKKYLARAVAAKRNVFVPNQIGKYAYRTLEFMVRDLLKEDVPPDTSKSHLAKVLLQASEKDVSYNLQDAFRQLLELNELREQLEGKFCSRAIQQEMRQPQTGQKQSLFTSTTEALNHAVQLQTLWIQLNSHDQRRRRKVFVVARQALQAAQQQVMKYLQAIRTRCYGADRRGLCSPEDIPADMLRWFRRHPDLPHRVILCNATIRGRYVHFKTGEKLNNGFTIRHVLDTVSVKDGQHVTWLGLSQTTTSDADFMEPPPSDTSSRTRSTSPTNAATSPSSRPTSFTTTTFPSGTPSNTSFNTGSFNTVSTPSRASFDTFQPVRTSQPSSVSRRPQAREAKGTSSSSSFRSNVYNFAKQATIMAGKAAWELSFPLLLSSLFGGAMSATSPDTATEGAFGLGLSANDTRATEEEEEDNAAATSAASTAATNAVASVSELTPFGQGAFYGTSISADTHFWSGLDQLGPSQFVKKFSGTHAIVNSRGAQPVKMVSKLTWEGERARPLSTNTTRVSLDTFMGATVAQADPCTLVNRVLYTTKAVLHTLPEFPLLRQDNATKTVVLEVLPSQLEITTPNNLWTNPNYLPTTADLVTKHLITSFMVEQTKSARSSRQPLDTWLYTTLSNFVPTVTDETLNPVTHADLFTQLRQSTGDANQTLHWYGRMVFAAYPMSRAQYTYMPKYNRWSLDFWSNANGYQRPLTDTFTWLSPQQPRTWLRQTGLYTEEVLDMSDAKNIVMIQRGENMVVGWSQDQGETVQRAHTLTSAFQPDLQTVWRAVAQTGDTTTLSQLHKQAATHTYVQVVQSLEGQSAGVVDGHVVDALYRLLASMLYETGSKLDATQSILVELNQAPHNQSYALHPEYVSHLATAVYADPENPLVGGADSRRVMTTPVNLQPSTLLFQRYQYLTHLGFVRPGGTDLLTGWYHWRQNTPAVSNGQAGVKLLQTFDTFLTASSWHKLTGAYQHFLRSQPYGDPYWRFLQAVTYASDTVSDNIVANAPVSVWELPGPGWAQNSHRALRQIVSPPVKPPVSDGLSVQVVAEHRWVHGGVVAPPITPLGIKQAGWTVELLGRYLDANLGLGNTLFFNLSIGSALVDSEGRVFPQPLTSEQVVEAALAANTTQGLIADLPKIDIEEPADEVTTTLWARVTGVFSGLTNPVINAVQGARQVLSAGVNAVENLYLGVVYGGELPDTQDRRVLKAYCDQAQAVQEMLLAQPDLAADMVQASVMIARICSYNMFPGTGAYFTPLRLVGPAEAYRHGALPASLAPRHSSSARVLMEGEHAWVWLHNGVLTHPIQTTADIVPTSTDAKARRVISLATQMQKVTRRQLARHRKVEAWYQAALRKTEQEGSVRPMMNLRRRLGQEGEATGNMDDALIFDYLNMLKLRQPVQNLPADVGNYLLATAMALPSVGPAAAPAVAVYQTLLAPRLQSELYDYLTQYQWFRSLESATQKHLSPYVVQVASFAGNAVVQFGIKMAVGAVNMYIDPKLLGNSPVAGNPVENWYRQAMSVEAQLEALQHGVDNLTTHQLVRMAYHTTSKGNILQYVRNAFNLQEEQLTAMFAAARHNGPQAVTAWIDALARAGYIDPARRLPLVDELTASFYSAPVRQGMRQLLASQTATSWNLGRSRLIRLSGERLQYINQYIARLFQTFNSIQHVEQATSSALVRQVHHALTTASATPL